MRDFRLLVPVSKGALFVSKFVTHLKRSCHGLLLPVPKELFAGDITRPVLIPAPSRGEQKRDYYNPPGVIQV